MSIPVLHTFVVGEVATASNINNNTVTLGNFLLAPPLAVLRATVNQGTTSGTTLAIAWDAEDIDRDSGHSTVTNTSRYTAQTPGWYRMAAHNEWAGNATGVRNIGFRVNGAGTVYWQCQYPASVGTAVVFGTSGDVFLNTNDYAEVVVVQNSGGALNVVGANGNCRWALELVST